MKFKVKSGGPQCWHIELDGVVIYCGSDWRTTFEIALAMLYRGDRHV